MKKNSSNDDKVLSINFKLTQKEKIILHENVNDDAFHLQMKLPFNSSMGMTYCSFENFYDFHTYNFIAFNLHFK